MIIAHTSDSGEQKAQSLEDHSSGVALLAGEFAKSLCNSDWAALAGYWHDLGKALPEWQDYLLKGGSRTVNHSESGAVWAFRRFCDKYSSDSLISKILPYLISGHHAGLPDWQAGSGNPLDSILHQGLSNSIDDREIKRIEAITELKSLLSMPLPKSLPFKGRVKGNEFFQHSHLWIRLLFSCVVDADYLDTEHFMSSKDSLIRGKYSTLTELKVKFDCFMAEKVKTARPSKLNTIRNDILQACIDKAQLSPGFFSLNVPTGGGKTLSSMAFALNHATKHGKKRIIVAIPYTSIIEQTAKIYKYGTDDDAQIKENIKNGSYLFGEENVLEHHTGVVFDESSEITHKNRLAAENWDVPVVVTTNVQLFESLFASAPSSCRKLHNIVDSVIILDEVQMLPPEFMEPILSVLQGLVECCGVTVILCTATQPALEGRIGSDCASFMGLPPDKVVPIIDDPDGIAQALKRVSVDTHLAREKIADWASVADILKEYEQVLCIVQTRKNCRELHSLMPPGTFHLSALMCGEDRSEVISLIKRKLHTGEPVRVISTQLVECGVDIDFPVVFRAMAGLDSIAQSAGRCNREGKNPEGGILYLFKPPADLSFGLLGKGIATTEEMLDALDYRLELSPENYRIYFKKYFQRLNTFDKPKFKERMIGTCTRPSVAVDGTFQFRTLAEEFHLIDDSYQVPVFIRYMSPDGRTDNINLLETLRNHGIDKDTMHRLSRFSVNLPRKEVEVLVKDGRIELVDDCFLQAFDDISLYKPGLGLMADSIKSYDTYIF